MMYIVLLSGGSGIRLWPMTTQKMPKQFLRLLPDLENASAPLKSMLQHIWHQLEQAGFTDKIVISTSFLHKELIEQQLPQSVELVLEPDRRDTYPATALAATYLFSEKKIPPDETILVLPVDTYVSASYFQQLKEVDKALQHTDAELALIGIVPNQPSEKYGYIVPEKSCEALCPYQYVQRFVEKPSLDIAKKLIKQGAFFNSGAFAFKLRFILEHLQSHNISLSYEALLHQYETLPKISFDYEVVEKSSHTIVFPYKGTWKDLGTWDALIHEMPENIMGEARISRDCDNVHILNETAVPVAVLGLSDLIVITTDNGILIAAEDACHRVKEINQ